MSSNRSPLQGALPNLVRTVGLCFMLTGGMKFVTLFSNVGILDSSDPVFNIPFRYVLASVGTLEIVVAALMLARPGAPRCLISGWSLAASIATYRIALYYMEYQKPCNCLGSITEIFKISERSADNIAIAILAYIVLALALATFLSASNRKGLSTAV